MLAGGDGVRLGGVDKVSIEVEGRTLLEHALAALEGIAEVVVVGGEVLTSRPVTFTRESPAGGGPAAGLLAGLRAFPRMPELVVVLAVDMPRVTPATINRLVVARTDAGALLIDGSGHRQPLCAVYSTRALDRARPPALEDEHGLPMRGLIARLDLAEVPEIGSEAADVDTWADLRDLPR